jgi:tetratricopeptide (TPR) repeat protein
MIKRLLFFCLIVAFCEIAAAQSDKEIKINHLKNQLLYLKDTARINCLNSIASLFSFSYVYNDYDSVNLYASPALKESRRLSYRRGVIAALFSLGNNEVRTNSADGEKHLKELISLSDDDSIISYAYLRLGQCLSNQAKYEEAIATLTTCAEHYKKKNKMGKFTSALGLIGVCYMLKGNYEKAFEYTQNAFQRSKSVKERLLSIPSNLYMADLYMSIQDYETAKIYIDQAFHLVTPKIIPNDKDSMIPRWIGRTCLSHRGDLYFHLGQYDSAYYFYQRASKGYTDPAYQIKIANVFLAQKQYDKALPVFGFSREKAGKVHDLLSFMQSLLGLSEVYLHKKKIRSAHLFAEQVLDLAQVKGNNKIMQDAYLLLTSVHEMIGKTDEALAYHKKYMQIRDSILNDQYKGKLFAYKQSAEEELTLSEINVLKKQKEISEQKLKIQQQQLKQSQLLKNVLFGSILLLGLLGYIFFHNILLKRKNERLQNQQMQAALKHKASDLEMQALRAQMNPHFIFNCLSSINRFILKNETEIASDYLTRFSRLIRLVLIHSQSSLILLKDELEMLRYYLDLEQLRFKNSFDYTITFANSIDPEITLIPPLLFQPFCENAIWHGLMHKEGKGHLTIRLSRKDDLLHCEIKDNGIGRDKAAEFKSKSGEKQKSMGLKLTSERLALINEEQGVKTSYEMEDLVENGEVAGTKVNLYIRYKDQVSEKKKELNYQS